MKAPSSGSPRPSAKGPSCGSTHLSKWKTGIENKDAQALWRSLHRLVSVHPLVRSALGSQSGSSQPTPLLSLHDLTQDLYVLLLQKGRFNHYLMTQMTDAEIERENLQIELTNLLIGNLRRRRPENYRIVRRVSGVLDSDPQFRRFKQRNGQHARYRQAAEALYGLREWNSDKKAKDSGVFSDLIAGIPMRMRNRRRAGCTGEAQVIVSNQELVELMVQIFEAIDSPAPLRVLRQLALSKLPVYDPEMTSIDDEVNEERNGRRYYDSIASSEASPEQLTLNDEQDTRARSLAAEFLDRLCLSVRSNQRRTERLWRVLWHCYFDPAEPSQLEIAEMVGISDSSVSDYRRKLESEMRKLDFGPDQLRSFAEELDELLQWRLTLPEQARHESAPELEIASPTVWSKFEYRPAAGLKTIPIV